MAKKVTMGIMADNNALQDLKEKIKIKSRQLGFIPINQI
jgi:hypothetical protein